MIEKMKTQQTSLPTIAQLEGLGFIHFPDFPKKRVGIEISRELELFVSIEPEQVTADIYRSNLRVGKTFKIQSLHDINKIINFLNGEL